MGLMSRVALKGILMAGGEGLLQLSDESPNRSEIGVLVGCQNSIVVAPFKDEQFLRLIVPVIESFDMRDRHQVVVTGMHYQHLTFEGSYLFTLIEAAVHRCLQFFECRADIVRLDANQNPLQRVTM